MSERKEPNPSHGKGGGDGKAKKKESILDLSKYLDKEIRVKFQGGREAQGVLKGYCNYQTQLYLIVLDCSYDQLLNLVIDSTSEQLRDMESPFGPSTETRQLGLVVCRGTSVVLISPQDGMEEIANPFIQQ